MGAAGMVAAATAGAMALADTVAVDISAGLAGTAAGPHTSAERISAEPMSAEHISAERMLAGRALAARILRPVQSEVAVRSVPASRRRGSAGRVTGSPPRR